MGGQQQVEAEHRGQHAEGRNGRRAVTAGGQRRAEGRNGRRAVTGGGQARTVSCLGRE